MQETLKTAAYLRSGPAPVATVSLTVRIATLTAGCWDSLTAVSVGELLKSTKSFFTAELSKSEIIIAETVVPAGSNIPATGSSNNAFADFILKRRLLICWPVLSATKLIYIDEITMIA